MSLVHNITIEKDRLTNILSKYTVAATLGTSKTKTRTKTLNSSKFKEVKDLIDELKEAEKIYNCPYIIENEPLYPHVKVKHSWYKVENYASVCDLAKKEIGTDNIIIPRLTFTKNGIKAQISFESEGTVKLDNSLIEELENKIRELDKLETSLTTLISLINP